MFTICSFNSPDLDGHRAPKKKYDANAKPQRAEAEEGVKEGGAKQHAIHDRRQGQDAN